MMEANGKFLDQAPGLDISFFKAIQQFNLVGRLSKSRMYDKIGTIMEKRVSPIMSMYAIPVLVLSSSIITGSNMENRIKM